MSENQTKICSRCKIEKILEEFHKDKTKRDGHKNICKECRNSIVTTENTKTKKEKLVLRGQNNVPKMPDNTGVVQLIHDFGEEKIEDLKKIINTIPILLEMIEDYQEEKKRKSESELIEGMFFDYPGDEITQPKSFRVTEEVWSAWQKLVRKNPDCKTQELYSQALWDFIQKNK